MLEIHHTDTGAETRIAIAGDLSIYGASEAHASLLAALAGEGPVEVDLSGITELDSAGFQLLWMLRTEAERRSRSLRFKSASTPVREVLELFGIDLRFVPEESPQAR